MPKKNTNLSKIFSTFSLAGLILSFASLPTFAQLSVDSDPFDIVEATTTGSCSIERPCIIYPREQSFDPDISNARRWRDADMSYKLNGSSSGEGNYLPELKAGAECRIQVRKFESSGSHVSNGYSAVLNRLRASNTFTEMDQSGDGNNDTMVMSYNLENGCGFTVPADEQTFVDWQINILVVNPDNTAFAASPAYFFKYGVVGVTFVS